MFGPASVAGSEPSPSPSPSAAVAAACMHHLYFLNSLTSFVHNMRTFETHPPARNSTAAACFPPPHLQYHQQPPYWLHQHQHNDDHQLQQQQQQQQQQHSAPCSPLSDGPVSPHSAPSSFCTGGSPSPASDRSSPAPSWASGASRGGNDDFLVLAGHHHHHQHRLGHHLRQLPFSIDNILRPDFGNNKVGTGGGGGGGGGDLGVGRYFQQSGGCRTAPFLRSPLENLLRTARLPFNVTSMPFNKITTAAADDGDVSDCCDGDGADDDRKPKSERFTDAEDDVAMTDVSSPPARRDNKNDGSAEANNKAALNKEDFQEKLLPNPDEKKPEDLLPAWVFCTRYSDRPSSGPRRIRFAGKKVKQDTTGNNASKASDDRDAYDEPCSPRSRRVRRSSNKDEKRPRTAFTADQLARLKSEFEQNRYLTEKRRLDLAQELKLNEAQIKIWFQNKRAKLKKASGQRGPLAMQLMAQGLYNHSTIPIDEDEDEESILAKYANHASLQHQQQEQRLAD